MSYDTVKNYVTNRLEGLGYTESKVPFDFSGASSREYGKTFILTPTEGSIDPDGENLNTRLYDNQAWSLSIAFRKSSFNDIVNRDDMYRAIEPIIKDLDNPVNYISTLRFLRYQSWEVDELDNYFLLKIKFLIQDQYTY